MTWDKIRAGDYRTQGRGMCASVGRCTDGWSYHVHDKIDTIAQGFVGTLRDAKRACEIAIYKGRNPS